MSLSFENITDSEFNAFQQLIEDNTGIHLAPHKRILLYSRLHKRLLARHCATFSEYYRLITTINEQQEFNLSLDLVTTNETYFFREQKHFDFLKKWLGTLPSAHSLRVWSAASSTGEEAYSIAMTLEDSKIQHWKIIASDINQQVLAQAKKAIYSDYRTEGMPNAYRLKYCQKGIDKFQGSFRVCEKIREKIDFIHLNLIEKKIVSMDPFDIIFLRNVMIYFEKNTQIFVIKKIEQQLKPKGYLIISHSETLHGLTDNFTLVAPGIYQRNY